MSVARVFIATVGVERSKLSRDRVDDLTIAVSEACTNALEAYRDAGQRDGRIRLRCSAEPGRLEVLVEDDGPGFGGPELKLTSLDGALTGSAVSGLEDGRGLSLIFALVDEAEVVSSSCGTTVRLVTQG
jgi:anti-sigma regulatory factor (Ser/Thr protein kinase)